MNRVTNLYTTISAAVDALRQRGCPDELLLL